MKIRIFLFLLALPISVYSQKELSFTDKTYEDQIKTVQVYPNLGGTSDSQQSPATPAGEQNLVLEFDDLQDQRNNYYIKLIHCNYDWTKSNLTDLDFMDNYNEFPINDYSFSSGTYIRYIHYKVQLPAVNLPGNYLLIAYREGDVNDIILSRRVMLYTNQVALVKDTELMGTGTLSLTHQQLNFVLDYSDIQVLNPLDNIHVTIRQNKRWDNMKENVEPSFLRDNDNILEYRFFDEKKQFFGGNEFRFVDFRSLNSPGQNTGKLDRLAKPNELTVFTDNTRGDGASYAQYKDINGGFQIDNLDTGEPATNGNYLNVTFKLKSFKQINGDIYLVGGFNDYKRSDENKLKYNATSGLYESRQFLKQGWYDYQYWVNSKTEGPYEFEGSHFETENMYEILVYNRALRPNADLLVGYYTVTVNPR